MAARLLVTAWKPDLMLATEHLEPHDSHCRKKSRVSFCRIVSGERQVWQVTYSLMYLLARNCLDEDGSLTSQSLTFLRHFRSVSAESDLWWWAGNCRRRSRSYPIQLTRNPINASAVWKWRKLFLICFIDIVDVLSSSPVQRFTNLCKVCERSFLGANT